MYLNTFTSRLAGVFLAAALCTACKKDAEDPKFMSWTLDGKNVTAAETNVSTSTTNSGNLAIAGLVTKGNAYPQMLLVVPKRTGNSDNSNYTVSAYYLPNSSTVYAVNSGNVTVTSYSTSNVAGTFRFTAEDTGSSDTKEVTNGKFNLNY